MPVCICRARLHCLRRSKLCTRWRLGPGLARRRIRFRGVTLLRHKPKHFPVPKPNRARHRARGIEPENRSDFDLCTTAAGPARTPAQSTTADAVSAEQRAATQRTNIASPNSTAGAEGVGAPGVGVGHTANGRPIGSLAAQTSRPMSSNLRLGADSEGGVWLAELSTSRALSRSNCFSRRLAEHQSRG
jgi:hypothetical protein